MKIAIQANPNRGKEIISLLKNLGGGNTGLGGNGEIYTYYIDKDNVIRYDYAPKDYKVYTLEEFEKDFPFKIGDIVLLKGINNPYEVIALEEYMNKLCYKLDNGLHYAPDTLITYEKMQEERNIKLTLDKAKEWYKKGRELREIALQAFTEQELNPLPRSWKEFCERYPVQGHEAHINTMSTIIEHPSSRIRNVDDDKNICPSMKSAEAHLAMMQLEQLRNCWWNGWEPEYRSTTYVIKRSNNEIRVIQAYSVSVFLSFPTKEMAEEFLKCFKDLIEKAGDLI